ncbi:MAG: Ig-like domain-containing protein, partial [Cyclobacteriaceae bacterium]
MKNFVGKSAVLALLISLFSFGSHTIQAQAVASVELNNGLGITSSNDNSVEWSFDITSAGTDEYFYIEFSDGSSSVYFPGGGAGVDGATTNWQNHVGPGGNITVDETDYSTVNLSSLSGDGGGDQITMTVYWASDNPPRTLGNGATVDGSTTQSFDNTDPTISIGSPSESIVNNAGSVEFTITYGGANAVTLANGNVTINNSTGSVNVTGAGTTTRTVTLSSLTGNNSNVSITIAAGTASDAAGNTAAGSGPSATFEVDNTQPAPTVSVDFTDVNSDAAINSAESTGSFEIILTYDEDLQTAAAPSVTLSGGTSTLTTPIAAVQSGSGNRIYTYGYTLADGDEEVNPLTITIGAGGTDVAGNTYSGAAGVTVPVTIDNLEPTFAGIILNGSDYTDAGPFPINGDNVSSVDIYVNGNTDAANGTFDVSISSNNAGTFTPVLGVSVNGFGNGTTPVDVSNLNDGTLTATVTLYDEAGNSAVDTDDEIKDVVDPTTPTSLDLVTADDSFGAGTTGTNADNITNVAQADFSLTTAETGIITISSNQDGILYQSATTDGAGTDVTYTTTGTLTTQGAHTISATLEDAAGNVSSAATLGITFDSQVSAPTGLDLATGSDSAGPGGSDSDNLTNDATPNITLAIAEDGLVVINSDQADGQIFSNNQTSGGVNASTGTLTVNAAHSITATILDLAGNQSSDSAPLAIIFDNQVSVPGVPDLQAASDNGSSSTDNYTSINTPVFDITASENGTLTVSSTAEGGEIATDVDAANGTNAVSTSVSVSSSAHNISSVFTDDAGNVSGSTGGLTITYDAPGNLDVTVNAVGPTNDVSPAISGTIAGAVDNDAVAISVQITNGFGAPYGPYTASTNSGGVWTISQGVVGPLAEDIFDIEVSATDLGGDTDAAAAVDGLDADFTSPTLTSVSISSNNGLDNTLAVEGNTVTLSFTANDDLATPYVEIGNGNTLAGGADNVSLSGSGTTWTATYVMQDKAIDTEGTVSFSIDFDDTAGNLGNGDGSTTTTTTDASSVTFDDTPPTVAITTSADDPTNLDDIPITIQFNQDVLGFNVNDVTVNGGAAKVSFLDRQGTVDGQFTFDLRVSAVADGSYTVDVGQGVATDEAGNGNDAATTFTILSDQTDPVIGSVTFFDMSGAGGTVYKVGDTPRVRFSLTDPHAGVSGASAVTVDFTAFGGGAAVVASLNSGTEFSGVWEATMASAIDEGTTDGNVQVAITAEDDATNSITATNPTTIVLDDDSPDITATNLYVSGATGAGGTIFNVDDVVTATWEADTDGVTDVTA